MQSKTNTFIETDGLGYGNPTHGNLGLREVKTSSWCNILNQPLISPLHEQFGGYIDRSYAVSISLKTAHAGEQNLRFAITSADILTPIARYACLSWVSCFNISPFRKSDRFKSLPEFTVRHSLNFSIGFPAELCTVKPFEFLNSDACIVFNRKINYFMCYLVASGFSEVSFVSPEFAKSTPCPVGSFALKDTPSNSNITFNLRNISAEVELLQDVTATVEYGYCGKNLGSNIHSNHIRSLDYLELFAERSMDNPFPAFLHELELGKLIFFVKKFLKASIRTVLLNGYGDPAAYGRNRYNWISPFSRPKASASGNVVGNRDRFELFNLMLSLCPDISSGILNKLGLKLIFRTNSIIGKVM